MEQIWSGFAAAAAMNGTNLLSVVSPFLLQYTLKATAVPTLHSQGARGGGTIVRGWGRDKLTSSQTLASHLDATAQA